MKRMICKLKLSVALLAMSQYVFSQEVRYVTEKFNIPKEQCVVYAYDLEDFLKSRGLYEGLKLQSTRTGTMDRIKKKLNIGGIDFTKDYVFVVGLWGGKIYDDSSDWIEAFGIIEVGFATESKAKEVCQKANETRKKYTMNIPLYCPPFRCIHVGKSVLFVYSINVNMDKYRDMAEKWLPESNVRNEIGQ